MAKKVDQTKIERIRNASVEVISEHGILGGSVASIAERADVSVGYLYRHYPGKTELINDLLENALNAITDRIHALIRETDDIERIVGGIVGFLIESAADNPAKHKFLIMLLNDFSVEIKPESRKRIIEIGEVLLETGQKNHTVRGDISVNDLYIALVGIPMQYLASRYRFDFDSRPCDTQELIRKIVCHFPGTKEIPVNLDYSRLCQCISLGIRSGLSPELCVELAGAVVTQTEIREKLTSIQKQLAEGYGFTEAITESGLFKAMELRLISLGFQAGASDEVMEKLAEQYEEKSTDAVSHIVSILEPTIVIVLSILVGLVLLSVMMPLLGLLSEMIA